MGVDPKPPTMPGASLPKTNYFLLLSIEMLNFAMRYFTEPPPKVLIKTRKINEIQENF